MNLLALLVGLDHSHRSAICPWVVGGKCAALTQDWTWWIKARPCRTLARREKGLSVPAFQFGHRWLLDWIWNSFDRHSVRAARVKNELTTNVDFSAAGYLISSTRLPDYRTSRSAISKEWTAESFGSTILHSLVGIYFWRILKWPHWTSDQMDKLRSRSSKLVSGSTKCVSHCNPPASWTV